MYLNFLRQEEVKSEQFEQLFSQKQEKVLKSKIIQVNSSIMKEASDIKKVFRLGTQVDNHLRFCLTEGVNEHIFLGQAELLRNNKMLIKVLAVPSSEEMLIKARDLLDGLTFLLS